MDFSIYHICLRTNMINTINAFNKIIEETLITNLTDSLKSIDFHPHSMMNIMVEII